MAAEPRYLAGTLAHLLNSGQEVVVHCESCWHRAPVDLRIEIEFHGEAYSLQSFIDGVVCSKCGARWPKLNVSVMPLRKHG